MKFRETDEEAKKEFQELGLTLVTKTIYEEGFDLHYVQIGSDTLPTLFFVHGSPGSWNAFKRYLQDKDLIRHYRMVAIDRPGFGFSEFNDARNLSEQTRIIDHLLTSIRNDKPSSIATRRGPIPP